MINETYLTILILGWFIGTILIFTCVLNIHPGKFLKENLIHNIKNVKSVLNKLFHRPYSVIAWFASSFIILLGIIIILPFTINTHYTYSEIIENIYPEIYGLLFDVILFGIVISIYQIATDRKRSIEIEIDQIDDFRGWNSKEASHRILGSIKRLNRLNVCNLDLNSCFFEEIEIRDLSFVDSKMTGLFLLKTHVYNTTFYNIKSNIMHCRDSEIFGCSFQEGKIEFNLHTTEIRSSLFKNINISSASFFTNNLSFTLFDNVNFSYSFFKFKKCSFVEFVNCIFDECIVDDYFFKEISDPNNCILGFDKILQEYDLIQEVSSRTGTSSPIWILRNKISGKAPRPVHTVEPGAAIGLVDPWGRIGRCRPRFHLNQYDERLLTSFLYK